MEFINICHDNEIHKNKNINAAKLSDYVFIKVYVFVTEYFS